LITDVQHTVKNVGDAFLVGLHSVVPHWTSDQSPCRLSLTTAMHCASSVYTFRPCMQWRRGRGWGKCPLNILVCQKNFRPKNVAQNPKF